MVRHELTHYLTLQPLLGAPTWLKEGLAEYVSTQPAAFGDVPVDPSVAAHVREVRHELPTTGRWGLDPDADYLVARAAVTHLVDTYGVDRVLDLAQAYRRIPGDDPDQKTDRVLRHALGLSETDLVDATWDELDQLGVSRRCRFHRPAGEAALARERHRGARFARQAASLVPDAEDLTGGVALDGLDVRPSGVGDRDGRPRRGTSSRRRPTPPRTPSR